jgi:hypothetical protein
VTYPNSVAFEVLSAVAMNSSGTQRRVSQEKPNDVSEEHIAFMIRVEHDVDSCVLLVLQLAALRHHDKPQAKQSLS